MLATIERQETAGARTTPRYSCITIVDRAELLALESDWRELEARTDGAIFFQSFDWCRLVCDTLAAAESADRIEPLILVVRDGQRVGACAGAPGKDHVGACAGAPGKDHVVLIWPLAIRRSAAGAIVQDLGEPFGQYSDALIDPACDAVDALDAAWATLRQLPIDGMLLRRVRADAAIRPWLTARARPVGEATAAPVVELSRFASFAAYHGQLTAKTRKNLRNYRNRLTRLGRLSHQVITDTPTRSDVIDQCFVRRADWLDASGLSSQAFTHPAFKALVAALARAEAIDVMAMRLRLELADSTSIDLSVQWGFLHHGRYYAFMAARNPDFDAFSAGRLHLEDVIAAAASRGIGSVDFLAPDMPYKATWATASVGVQGFGIGVSARGRIAIVGWHGALRPILKSAVTAMPAPIRRIGVATLRRVTR